MDQYDLSEIEIQNASDITIMPIFRSTFVIVNAHKKVDTYIVDCPNTPDNHTHKKHKCSFIKRITSENYIASQESYGTGIDSFSSEEAKCATIMAPGHQREWH